MKMKSKTKTLKTNYELRCCAFIDKIDWKKSTEIVKKTRTHTRQNIHQVNQTTTTKHKKWWKHNIYIYIWNKIACFLERNIRIASIWHDLFGIFILSFEMKMTKWRWRSSLFEAKPVIQTQCNVVITDLCFLRSMFL